MTRRDYLHDALGLVTMRHESVRLAGGFALATGEVLRLFGWHPELADDGSILWRPMSASSTGARARYRPEDGGHVDVIAGDLHERHVDAWDLLRRLVRLTAHGVGKIPEPTIDARQCMARALAAVAGVEDDLAAIEETAQDDRSMDTVWQIIAELRAAAEAAR
ncbi:hypothetical protein ACNRBH_09120 [Ralstonia pseudosolanacearum]|uniref:hypothetical protein n=1 Tax=Ralstonia pseudosolanacearum TaxID=1310165 RepID=UPI0026765AF4|nr:hypothetical protein [Ralstonia pseudosolanacearum]MDO3527521.1 hypothetical protein [Ralstonia pseudosolanacearum]MDO3531600.1 hypothetical protein [Ralstonia pseudosolanacearum]